MPLTPALHDQLFQDAERQTLIDLGVIDPPTDAQEAIAAAYRQLAAIEQQRCAVLQTLWVLTKGEM